MSEYKSLPNRVSAVGSMTLRYTTTPPSEPGLYWTKKGLYEEIANVFYELIWDDFGKYHQGERLMVSVNGHIKLLSDTSPYRKWAGPIPRPEDSNERS